MSLTTLEVALARYPSTAEAMLVWGRIRLQDELEHLALDDRLTGLANRRLLQEYLTPHPFGRASARYSARRGLPRP